MPVGRSTYCVWEQLVPQDGHLAGQIGSQMLHLPLVSPPQPAHSAYVQFSPQDVMLSRDDIAGISARNHLRGQIRQFVELPERVFVAVDIGQIIWCELTPEACAAMDLRLGHRDRCAW